jgi:hypothetical protein
MTTLLSRAAQLTAGRCGSGGERDFVAELLWRTPRRLLYGRAQIGTDTISQRQRLRGKVKEQPLKANERKAKERNSRLLCYL